MSSVYFDPAYGGDGSTVTDDANATTGLDNYGYTLRFVPAMGQVLSVASFVVTRTTAASGYATAAAASAASALNAPGTNATSATSVAIATGSKSFTIQTGKAYVVGQTLNLASAANPANFMAGQITAYNSATGALVVNVTQVGGSGTLSDWVVSMGAIVSSTLPSQSGATNLKFLQSTGTAGAEQWGAAVLPANNGSDFTNFATFRTNVGLAIGSNVQAYHANLAAFAGLSLVADRLPYANGTGTLALATFTAAGRALLDDADAAAQRTTLGLVIGTNVQAQNANLQAVAGLTLAADKLIYATGAGAVALTDMSAFARTILDDANAGAVRDTISAAAKGANNDITSLTGLTTPLSTAQGGTGRATTVPEVFAMVTFTISGTTATIRKSHNVASVTYVSTGVWEIAFTNNATNEWYAIHPTTRRPSSNNGICVNIDYATAPTVSLFRVGAVDMGGSPLEAAEMRIICVQ